MTIFLIVNSWYSWTLLLNCNIFHYHTALDWACSKDCIWRKHVLHCSTIVVLTAIAVMDLYMCCCHDKNNFAVMDLYSQYWWLKELFYCYVQCKVHVPKLFVASFDAFPSKQPVTTQVRLLLIHCYYYEYTRISGTHH